MGNAAAGAVFALMALIAAPPANAAGYGRNPDSAFDTTYLAIAEKEFLGNKIDGTIQLADQDGKKFALGDFFDKPLILVFSYYTCDGVCSVVNADLKAALEKASRIEPGADYRVLTISFDSHDTAATLSHFRGDLSLSPRMAGAWKHALAINFADAERLAKSAGFRYFWSARDKTFFHPNVYIFISPDGRIARYLYSSGAGARDIEVAVMETAQGQIRPAQLATLALSLCYSYNYKTGKYMLSIPVFIGLGSLCVGVASFLVSVLIYRKRKTKQEGF